MKVAIVILNWNGEKLLPKFLPSVIEHSKQDDVEVIVVDNASEDKSLDVLDSLFPNVRQIILDKNYGFAEGYNRALKEVEAEYYILLNSDVEVTKGWLTPMIELMDKNQDIAACGPKILDYKNKSHFEYAGAAGGFIDKYAYPFCRGRIFDAVEEDNNQHDTVEDVVWVSGCALMIRASLYKKHGGLDKNFFAHMEEIDLCWRLKNRGFRIVNIPQSTIYHQGGATLKVGSPRKAYLNFRNSLLTLYKNTDEKQFLKAMKVRRRLDFIAAVKFLLTDGGAHYEAVFKAHQDFQKLLPQYKKEKEEQASLIDNYDTKLVLQKSIVLTFYINRVKFFSKLKF